MGEREGKGGKKGEEEEMGSVEQALSTTRRQWRKLSSLAQNEENSAENRISGNGSVIRKKGLISE